MLPSKAKWKNNAQINNNFENFNLPLSKLSQQLLRQRGISTTEQAKSFLSPQLVDLYDPFLLKDMEKAVDRVQQAIRNQEKILVFGDYDADGVSSTSVMVETLLELGASVDYYIPNRFTEGYGPNPEAFQAAKDNGVSLIITVDTGIAAVGEAELAKELGIDLIITDHHEVQDTVPPAFAIIHPKLSEEYPFSELAGVGVAFKFAHALLGEVPLHLLDLVVIGTIADLVPLKDENRILAFHGLKAISHTSRYGLQALKKVCGIEGNVTEEDIGFSIGPRINAVGRLQDAFPAVELMLTNHPEEAAELAEMIQNLNKERQKIVADTAQEAESFIEENQFQDDSVLIVAKQGWNQGILGIVASRVVNRYDRPTIVLTIDEEGKTAKGSARSIDAFDLFTNCMQVRELFTHFGGHAQAAGMTLPVENIEALREALNNFANNQLTEEDFKPLLSIDAEIDLEQLTLDTIEEINKLAPFGMGNPKPLFKLTDFVPSEIRQIGSQLNHLKLLFKGEENQMDAIGFGMGDIFPNLSPLAKLSAVGELSINEWNGRRKMQLMLKDIEVSEWQLFDYRGTRQLSKLFQTFDNKKLVVVHFQDLDGHSKQLTDSYNKIHVKDKHAIKSLEKAEFEGIILLDLPSDLEILADVISKLGPKRIYTCYRIEQAQFLQTLPTREHFKWFYGLLIKRKQLNLETDGHKIAKLKGWSKDSIDFITKVFFELEFVKIDNGLVSLNPNPAKKDLTESKLYQQKFNQLDIEKTLYFSSQLELKEWFNKQMHTSDRLIKEEIVYGL